MTQDELFMLRALELAKLAGSVSPNPKVGCVIVYENKIIGEGWHKFFGGAHAEVNAIESVVDKTVLNESKLYVTLEPCSHTGKTPPCADLLIKHKIAKVLIAVEDPNPLVAGKGIRKLKQAGIQVEVGLLSRETELINTQFFTYFKFRRPYIILKWAQTADGFIAPVNRERKSISNKISTQLVHKWRAEVDAILVGSDTVLHDDPQLNVRQWVGRNPTRVVLDRNLKLSRDLNVFKQGQKTICYNLLSDSAEDDLIFIKLPEVNFLAAMLQNLIERGIQSLLVEGGATIHALFITANYWDEARIIHAPIKFNEGVSAPEISGSITAMRKLNEDFLEVLKNDLAS
jgi:diaminohydroxyphosphoribosylaminopyrimidine deaminase / 5-amino-6-(5-phosphoribosylamino)uracil reductase